MPERQTNHKPYPSLSVTLQVVDLTNLHPGISQYYRANTNTITGHRNSGLKPLNLMHYTGERSQTVAV